MQIPLQITFRNMEPSEALEARIREKTDKLEKFAEYITSCRVIVESPHNHQNKGKLFQVKVDITLPGKEIVASRMPDQHSAYQDVYVALRDAFDAAKRQLEDYVRKRRGDVKTHEISQQHGRVAQLYPVDDYGIIRTMDNREIYFHRNSVLGVNFDKLEVGTPVHFSEEMGEDGPQASTVHVEGKHHVV